MRYRQLPLFSIALLSAACMACGDSGRDRGGTGPDAALGDAGSTAGDGGGRLDAGGGGPADAGNGGTEDAGGGADASSGDAGGSGEPCTSNDDCPGGYCYAEISSDGFGPELCRSECIEARADGLPAPLCDELADCCSADRCVDGTCISD